MPRGKKTPLDRFVEDLLTRAERSRSASQEYSSPGLQARKGEAYRQALWYLWTLPPDAPQSAYDQALDEVLLQEAALPPLEAQATHREEAHRFHRETGRCPFCQEEGELHLDAPLLRS